MIPDTPMTAEERSRRAAVAARTRHHPNDPETEKLAAEFKADRLERYIRRIVDAAPPLDSATRDRLALLLRGAGVSS